MVNTVQMGSSNFELSGAVPVDTNSTITFTARRIQLNHLVVHVRKGIRQLGVFSRYLLARLRNYARAERRVFELRAVCVHSGHSRPLMTVEMTVILLDQRFVRGG